MKKQLLFVIGIVCCCVPLFFGMIWLTMLFGLSLSYIFIFKKLSKQKFQGQKLIRSILILFGVLMFSIAIRLFGFEIYAIPTPSMENSIMVGDKVLVSKLKHGPSLPKSPFEIPWINLFFYFNKACAESAESIDWGYNRLAGYSDFERGDILVFNHPQLNQVFIKRCVGLPGDTIEIRKGYLYVNGEPFNESSSMKMPYQIMADPGDSLRNALKDLKVFGRWASPKRFDADMTTSQVNQVTELSDVYFLKLVTRNRGFDHSIYPYKDDHYHTAWSIDNYGPYVVPKEGMEIGMNPKNFNHYHAIIQDRDLDHEQLTYSKNKYYLGRNEIKSYKFNKDFYFFMGDNRHNSNDSRYWGPVQEDKIIGVASTILFSNPNNEFDESRLLKPID